MSRFSFSYRTDIDGLRALAVLGVVAFHIAPWTMPGGFIGVDMFFVISGFLITSILWRDFDRDSFSLSTFYVKRIKRLFPALFVVIVACACLQLMIGLPDEVRSFGTSAIASVFYISNHYFLSVDGYFENSLETNPLLHTWSLSVEEQFYIFFPVLLFLIFKHDRYRVTRVLIILGCISLLLSEALLHVNKSTSFYITPSRIWQFFLGAVIALNPLKRTVARWRLEALSLTSIAVLLVCFFVYSGRTAFPGLLALIPTVATGFVIFAGQQEGLYISKLLSNPLARFFGKISYSLYLWHWPIIVFYKLQIEPEPSTNDKYLIIVSSIVAGYLSWRFIEQPLRHVSFKYEKATTYALGAISTIIVGGIGFFLMETGGIRWRDGDQKLTYIEYLNYDADPYYRTGTCFLTSKSPDISSFDEDICIDFNADKSNVLIVGDSHSAQYYQALKENIPSVEFSQVSASGCRPLINYEGADRCTSLMRLTFERYIKEYDFDAIILAGRWEERDVEVVQNTISTLKESVDKVIVLGPIIEYTQALPRLLARYDEHDPELDAARMYKEVKEIDFKMESMVELEQFEYYSILGIICPDEGCKVFTEDGTPVQFDASHLTHPGAIEVVQALLDVGFLENVTEKSPS